MKKYKQENPPQENLEEPMATYTLSANFFPSMLGSRTSSSSRSLAPKDPLRTISLIKSGISKQSLDSLLEATGISSQEMSSYMHISERTLRNYTSNTLLNPEMTERALEIAQLYEKGCAVFGSISSFQKYMNSEIPALANQKPKSFLDTSVGIQYLMDELGRIEHGILA